MGSVSRPFRGAPGFSVFFLFGMALTIGLVVAALPLGEILSIPPLNAADPDELAAFYESSLRGRQTRLSYPLFIELRRDCRSCAQVAAAHLTEITFQLGSTVDSAKVEFVSDEYFTALGLKAGNGRFFGANQSRDSDDGMVVVVGERFGRRHFADGTAVGSQVALNGRPFTVIGVLAGDFAGLGYETELWLPLDGVALLGPEIDSPESPNTRWLSVFTRLTSSSAGPQATNEMQAIASRYQEAGLLAHGDALRCGPEGFPRSGKIGNVALLSFLLGGGGFVTLLALCLNAALVMVAHGAARRSEVAIKLALGASKRKILGERAREMAILATVGGGLAYLVACSILAVLPRVVPNLPQSLGNPRLEGLPVALVLAWIIGNVSILPVAFQTSDASLATVLAGSQGALTMSLPTYRFRKWLVGAQVALCIVLVSSGVLLFHSIENMKEVHVASEPERLLFTKVAPTPVLQSRETGQPAYLGMLEILESLEPVESASLVSHVPIGGGAMAATVALRGEGGADESRFPPVDILLVGPRFFSTFGLHLLAGRDFALTDRAGEAPVAAVNKTFAEKLADKGGALGQVISVLGGEATIVAVLEDAKRQALSEGETPQVYLPFLQRFEPRMVLVSRTSVDAAAVAPLIRQELQAQAKVRVLETFSLKSHIDNSLQDARTAIRTLLAFGTIILALSLGGVYAVASLLVVERRREIGLRLALGSTRVGIAGRVIREIALLTTASMVAGLAITFAVAHFLKHVLYGVGPVDPVTVAASLALTCAATGLALVKPVFLALRVQPGELLRST